MTNLPPGASAGDPNICGEETAHDRVFDYLNQCRMGSSEDVMARALRMTEHEVGAALDALLSDGAIRVVRRTKSRITYGVVADTALRDHLDGKAGM